MSNVIRIFITISLLSISVLAQGPQIRVQPNTLDLTTSRFLAPEAELTIYNDGDQPLTLSLTDEAVTLNKQLQQQQPVPAKLLAEILKHKLSNLQLEAPQTPALSPATAFDKAAIVITDPAGDTQAFGVDVVSVDISSNALFWDVEIEFAAPVDTAGLALMAIDIDQNMATGEFPAPLGFGIGSYDLGADFNLIFDIANLVGDSLGIAPSAIAITGDGSFTPVGLPTPLSISGNTVSATLLRAITPIFDGDVNVSVTTFSLNSTSFPDLAPDFGHGLRGNEDGLSWLAHSDTSGASDIPFQATVAAGDSTIITNLLAAVNPPGSYAANINIANNSINTPSLTVPVNVTINGPQVAMASVSPSAIADSLMENQGTTSYQVELSNSGDGSLIYFLSDSSAAGEDWFSLDAFIPIGRIESGQSETVTLNVNPAGLIVGQTYSAKLQIITNDTSNMVIDVPVDITIESATSIDPQDVIPTQMTLLGNYPNPFNPSTTIRYELSTPQKVSIKIFDALGRIVRVLNDSPTGGGGIYSIEWDGRDSVGNSVGSGIYYYRLTSESGQSASRKMILLK